MRTMIFDKKYNFITYFDTKTGQYIRTGIIDSNGKDTNVDPFMASFPHLIDVGIMGHCVHGKTGLCVKAGIGCYQNGLSVSKPNMVVDDFEWLANQCKKRVNQFALGGRGDPDQHEHFGEILEICKSTNIVPNFTTSGYGLTSKLVNLCKNYCGAVAVSWYRNKYTIKSIQMLVDSKIKTNIHYVLGNNSIDEAIERLQNNTFPNGINAVVFLLHKPVGLGTTDNMLSVDNPKLKIFFNEFSKTHPFKIGIDSCTVPGLINFGNDVDYTFLDTCEGGRFSCYISSDLKMTPCSFDQNDTYSVQLNNNCTIEQAWNSEQFNKFRNILQNHCKNCKDREICMGGCPLNTEIVLCNRKDRN